MLSHLKLMNHIIIETKTPVRGWSFLKNEWCKKTAIYTVAYLLFIFVPIIGASITLSGETIEGASDATNLNTLPYLKWVSAEGTVDKHSVTKYNPDLSFKGVNLYMPVFTPAAFLIDMNGNILHQWIISAYERRGNRDHGQRHQDEHTGQSQFIP